MKAELLNKIMPDIDNFVKGIPAFPSVELAKEILRNSELINPGTEDEFVKGYMGNRYRDAVMVLSREFQEIKELLEEKG